MPNRTEGCQARAASTTLEGASRSRTPISINQELGAQLDWRAGGQS